VSSVLLTPLQGPAPQQLGEAWVEYLEAAFTGAHTLANAAGYFKQAVEALHMSQLEALTSGPSSDWVGLLKSSGEAAEAMEEMVDLVQTLAKAFGGI
jgi:hypothetical protein